MHCSTTGDSMPRASLPLLVALCLVAACDQMKHHGSSDKSMSKMNERKGAVAVARIMPAKAAATQPSFGTPTGTVTFTQMGERTKVVADLTGLPPGKHGIHIHEKGDLSSADLMSAGGHFNPGGHPHGGPTT